MNAPAYQIQATLRIRVDEGALVEETSSAGFGLSPYLRGGFDFYEATIVGEKVVMAAPAGSAVVDEGVIKRAELLQEKIGRPIALYLPAVDPGLRKSLLAARRGFVTLAGDVYLPSLALFLSARTTASYEIKGRFKPAEQLLFLYCLYSEDGDIVQSRARAELGMSATGVSRALGQLVERGLLDYQTVGVTGRLKSYSVPNRVEYYRKGLALFGSPVSRRIVGSLAHDARALPLGGLSALSSLSDLTPPAIEVRAIGPRGNAGAEALGGADAGARAELQILRYDPAPIARKAWGDDSCVDPVTMMLTVDEHDERISIATREVMGRFSWYTE